MRYYQIGEAAELTKRDIASIEAHMGRCCEKCFPKIYEGGPRPSYMEAIRSWFTLASGRKTEGITAPEDGREPLPGRKIRPQDQTAEEIFVISLIDSYRDEIHTRYQEIYMPL